MTKQKTEGRQANEDDSSRASISRKLLLRHLRRFLEGEAIRTFFTRGCLYAIDRKLEDGTEEFTGSEPEVHRSAQNEYFDNWPIISRFFDYLKKNSREDYTAEAREIFRNAWDDRAKLFSEGDGKQWMESFARCTHGYEMKGGNQEDD